MKKMNIIARLRNGVAWRLRSYRSYIIERLSGTIFYTPHLKWPHQRGCVLLQDKPFFLQAQMDINHLSPALNPDFVAKTGGFFLPNDSLPREILTLHPWDNTRRDMLILLLRSIIQAGILGDIAELGVYRGWTAKLIHYYAPEKMLYLFDTFEGFTSRGALEEKQRTGVSVSAEHFADTTLQYVQNYISPKNDNVHFIKGFFPDSIPPGLFDKRFAFVHLDADLYDPIHAGLEFFYPRLSPGGILVIHDYNCWLGARLAADAFFRDKPEFPIPMPDKAGSALIVKQRTQVQ